MMDKIEQKTKNRQKIEVVWERKTKYRFKKKEFYRKFMGGSLEL